MGLRRSSLPYLRAAKEELSQSVPQLKEQMKGVLEEMQTMRAVLNSHKADALPKLEAKSLIERGVSAQPCPPCACHMRCTLLPCSASGGSWEAAHAALLAAPAPPDHWPAKHAAGAGTGTAAAPPDQPPWRRACRGCHWPRLCGSRPRVSAATQRGQRCACASPTQRRELRQQRHAI